MPNTMDPVPQGTTLQSGDPLYQQQVFSQRKALLAPQYAQAVQKARQVQANRGFINSGLGGEQEQVLGQQYRGALDQAASEAATGAADQAEQNRRMELARLWHTQDRDLARGDRRDELAAAADQANRNQWSNLLGGAVGAATGVGGNLLARKLFPQQFEFGEK